MKYPNDPRLIGFKLQQQLANASSNKQQRSQRSDSDSESVFTDDDEWAHPLPLRENIGKLVLGSSFSHLNPFIKILFKNLPYF